MRRIARVTLVALVSNARATFKDKEMLEASEVPAPKEMLEASEVPAPKEQLRDASTDFSGLSPSSKADLTSTGATASASFQSLGSELDHLRQQMDAMREQKSIEVNLQRAKYQQMLMTQDRENSAIYAKNLNIMGAIEAHQHKLRHLRRTAEDIEEDSERLRHDMLALSDNISVARDFIQEALDHPDGSSDPEVRVLAEVSAKKDELKRERSKEKRIREIDQAGTSPTMSNFDHSFLQLNTHTALLRPHAIPVDAASQVDPDDALEVMHSLKRSISELLSHHNMTLTELEASYNQSYEQGARTMRSLQSKQLALNSTQETLLSLEPRLDAAVAFESNTRTYLHSRLSALRSYIGLLSQWPEEMQEEHMLARYARATTSEQPSTRHPSFAAPAAFEVGGGATAAVLGLGSDVAAADPGSSVAHAAEAPDVAAELADADDGAGASGEDGRFSSADKEEGLDGVAALLQVGSTVSARPMANLREVPPVTDESTEAFATMDMRLTTINQEFASMDRAQREAQENKMVSYSQELLSKNTDSLKRAKANARLASTMLNLKSHNHKMLMQARKLQKEIELLRADMTSLQLNLSIAVEFADETLRKSNHSAAPELSVLRMLAQKESVQSAAEEHKSQIDEVSGSFARLQMEITANGDSAIASEERFGVDEVPLTGVGLLQTAEGLHRKSARRQLDELLEVRRQRQATSSPPPTVDEELVASLDALEARIQDLAADRRKAEEGFEAQFHERLNKSAGRQEMLAKEGEALEASKASMEAFRERLVRAVHHLDDIHQDLLSKGSQVRSFLRGLGIGKRHRLQLQPNL